MWSLELFEEKVPSAHTDLTYTVHTRPYFNFDNIWLKTDRTMFKFKVRACRSAHICLAQTTYAKDENSAQITIGGDSNTKTTITPDRTKPNEKVSQDTYNVLDCDTMREFWIDWDNSKIRVGQGQPYADQIVEADYDLPWIVAVSISTDKDVEGDWEFRQWESMLALLPINPAK